MVCLVVKDTPPCAIAWTAIVVAKCPTIWPIIKKAGTMLMIMTIMTIVTIVTAS